LRGILLAGRGRKLMLNLKTIIEDSDFTFENKLVSIVAMRDCSKIEIGGLSVGPFEEGQEYKVRFWIAKELERTGIARVRDEELLDTVRLYKIQWTERVQSVMQITSLSEDFYPKLRRYIRRLKKDALRDPDRMREYERARRWAQDILNCRLKKIIALASSSKLTNQFIGNLTIEERRLYEQLRKMIEEWRSNILKVKNE